MAKLGGIFKVLSDIDWGKTFQISGARVDGPIEQFFKLRKELITLLPDLYADLPEVPTPISIDTTASGFNIYQFSSIAPIIDNIKYILEVRANHRIGEKSEIKSKSHRVFISHGRSEEWYKLQSYLERDLGYQTLELAQEANMGRTVMEKLNQESTKCTCAVIVMTGDDKAGDETRARENVLHEIGFFQGKYGFENVILLHEEGVNIPSNIHGLVYISFPKGTVETTFAGVHRELKVIIG